MKLNKLSVKVKDVKLEVLAPFRPEYKKLEFQEIQRVVIKLKPHKKKTVHFKMSKELFNKINNNE